MMTIIDKYVAKQLVFACVLAILVLSGPVVLVTLFKNLPSEAIFTELFWPSLYGIACMILYVSLPVPISIAIVWTYSRLASDSALIVFHSAGISTMGVRAPAFFVAACGAALGYAMSCFFAPHSANKIHDMLFSLRHDITPALLQEGKFNEISGGRQVIYFSKRVSRTEFSDVFINEVTDDYEEKAYYARSASFVRNADGSWIVLRDGSMQVTNPSHTEVRSLAFDQIVRPATRSGGPKLRRGDLFYDELAGFDFIRAAPSAFANPATAREWAKEAVKRFGFPPLAIIHTMLGLELLGVWGGLSGRLHHPTALVCATLMSAHVAIAVTAEYVARINATFAWVVVMMIVAELGAAVLIAMFRSGRFTRPVELRDASDVVAADFPDPVSVSLASPQPPFVEANPRRGLAFRHRTADRAPVPHRLSPPVPTRKSLEGLSDLP